MHYHSWELLPTPCFSTATSPFPAFLFISHVIFVHSLLSSDWYLWGQGSWSRYGRPRFGVCMYCGVPMSHDILVLTTVGICGAGPSGWDPGECVRGTLGTSSSREMVEAGCQVSMAVSSSSPCPCPFHLLVCHVIWNNNRNFIFEKKFFCWNHLLRLLVKDNFSLRLRKMNFSCYLAHAIYKLWETKLYLWKKVLFCILVNKLCLF